MGKQEEPPAAHHKCPGRPSCRYLPCCQSLCFAIFAAVSPHDIFASRNCRTPWAHHIKLENVKRQHYKKHLFVMHSCMRTPLRVDFTQDESTQPTYLVCQKRMSQRMSEEMSDNMSGRKVRKNVRIGCQKRCQKICQKRMSEDMSEKDVRRYVRRNVTKNVSIEQSLLNSRRLGA